MAPGVNTPPEFDAGPLSWVQGEIDEALARGIEALETFVANPGDATSLRHARTHVHQAAGAVQMVGLDAVVAYTDEIERHLGALDGAPANTVAVAAAPVNRACRKLRIFLAELVDGAPPVPLKLFPEYEAMQKARGMATATPTDLFYPDLSAPAPAPRRGEPGLTGAALSTFLVNQRRNFQRGLLGWLRGSRDGARQMRETIAAIEQATTTPNLRAFWWSAGVLTEALAERGIEPDFGVKQLLARLDLQIRRLAEGSAKVADRLRREVLYYVAISGPVTPAIAAVQARFGLPGLIPSAEVLNADLVRIQPHLREAREQLGQAKETWLKFTSGRAENLPKLKQNLASVHRHATETREAALAKLTAALVARLDRMSPSNVSEAVAMEYATALLLADSAFQNFGKLSPEFGQQVEVMLARLDAAQASLPFQGGDGAPMLEEMSRRAQDRLLLAQVGREIRANLRHMEQVLDAFFRDHGRREELKTLGKDTAQIRGALRMLELDAADELLAACEARITAYADPETAVVDDDLELLAESLSGLGFYIEAVEQQRADHARLIGPLLARQRGETPVAAEVVTDSVEMAVAQLRTALPALVEEVRRVPNDRVARETLRAKLAVLRDDAELIGDVELVVRAKAALHELDEGGTAGAAVTAFAEAPAVNPTPEVSQETQRLLAHDVELDAELLDIFLCEADEVLGTIAEQHRILSHNPADREALRTARRQFHTLKGSGRMVGLTDLGEIAYDVEKIHNRLLEEERGVTPAVLALLAGGEVAFRQWVGELRARGSVQPDPERLHAAIREVEAEFPRGRDSVLAGRAATRAASAPPAVTQPPLPAAAPAAANVTTTAIPTAIASSDAAAELSDSDALASVLAAYRGAQLDFAALPAAAATEIGARADASPAQDDALPPGPGVWVEGSESFDGFGEPVKALRGEPAHLSDAFSARAGGAEAGRAVEATSWSELGGLDDVGAVAEPGVQDHRPYELSDAIEELDLSWIEPSAAAGLHVGEPPPVRPAPPEILAIEWADTRFADEAAADAGAAAERSRDRLLDVAADMSRSDDGGRNVEQAEDGARDESLARDDAGDLDSFAWQGSDDAALADADAIDRTLQARIVGHQTTSAAMSSIAGAAMNDAVGEAQDRVVLRADVGHGTDDGRGEDRGPDSPSMDLDLDVGGTADGQDATEADRAPAPGSAIPEDVVRSLREDVADLDLDLGDAAVDLPDASPPEPATAMVAESGADRDAVSDDMTIGEVTLSRSLYEILIAEADEHLTTLGHELALMQFDPAYGLSAAMVRASHTLCGIHRTGGFPIVPPTAKALEQCLVALQRRGEPLSEATHAALARAIDLLGELVGKVRDQRPFEPEDVAEGDAIQAELDNVRQACEQVRPEQPKTVEPPEGAASEGASSEGFETGPFEFAEPGMEQLEDEHATAEEITGMLAPAARQLAGEHVEGQGGARAFTYAGDGTVAAANEDVAAGAPRAHDRDAADGSAQAAPSALDPAPGEAIAAASAVHADAAGDASMDASGATAGPGPIAESGGAHLPADGVAADDERNQAAGAIEVDALLVRALLAHFAEEDTRAAPAEGAIADVNSPATEPVVGALVPPPLDDESIADELAQLLAAESATGLREAPHLDASEQEQTLSEELSLRQPAPVGNVPGNVSPATERADHDKPAGEVVPLPSPVAVGADAGVPGMIDVERLVADALQIVPADAETPLDQISDDVDAQLLPIFVEEAEELFPQAGEELRAWRRNPPDATHAGALRRTLHTFKGSARMAGAMRLGELAHRMESRLLRGDDLVHGDPELFDALEGDLDRVAFVLDALRAGRTNVDLPWLDAAAAPAGSPPADARTHAAGNGSAAMGVVVPLPGIGSAHADASANADVESVPAVEPDATQRAMLRVRADIIDRLVNEAGEVAIARARVESELRALKANLLELTTSVIRMRTQVREIEIQAESQIQSRLSLRGDAHAGFDPLEFDRFTRFQELTRSLAEGINDVSTVQQSLLRNVDDADAALVAQARLSRDVQQQLFAIRTVPFSSVSERLYRILRQVAKELDKRVNLEIRGSQVELDRSVLEKLVGPLEHLLRNAIDHGIEPRDRRVQSGKAPSGEIAVTVRQVGNEIAIELADDGAGLDFERIRARAVAQGRIAPDARPTEAQLVECIFEPGFSTAAKVTHVSGRGIGMDVVRAEIAALGGRVDVTSRPGSGTTFLLYLPLTLAVAQAVLVRAGGRLWAVPAPMVEQVQQVKAEHLLECYASGKLNWQGRIYPLHYLPRLLGDTGHNPLTGRFNAVLLLRTGQGVTAVHVDEMVGNQEVVVKNIGPQLARVSGIAGATVLGTGEIVLIINPVQLAQRADIPGFDPHADDQLVVSRAAPVPAVRAPLAMIVDDSLTVRKMTSRLLTREGFEVITAKDGLDALQQLVGIRPDVILLDIEMPRMDGFEFTRTIKADARHADVPIIMITSRTAEKHRNLARDLGVDLFLGKPYQEDELLRTLREMLSVAA
ncbi:MAG: Hpt domain-containing protein [Casimicrobiaceae bacterium]